MDSSLAEPEPSAAVIELHELANLPANRLCADCGRTDPRWASYNLGVFVCVTCSGVHRSLGTHISKVRLLCSHAADARRSAPSTSTTGRIVKSSRCARSATSVLSLSTDPPLRLTRASAALAATLMVQRHRFVHSSQVFARRRCVLMTMLVHRCHASLAAQITRAPAAAGVAPSHMLLGVETDSRQPRNAAGASLRALGCCAVDDAPSRR